MVGYDENKMKLGEKTMVYELEKMCCDINFDEERASKLMKMMDVNTVFVDSRFKLKSTFLELAATWANIEMVKLLLENGADPNLVYDNGTENVLWNLQYSDRDIEVDKIRLQIVELLLQYGADPHLKVEGDDLMNWAISCYGELDEGIQADYRFQFIRLLEKYDTTID